MRGGGGGLDRGNETLINYKQYTYFNYIHNLYAHMYAYICLYTHAFKCVRLYRHKRTITDV